MLNYVIVPGPVLIGDSATGLIDDSNQVLTFDARNPAEVILSTSTTGNTQIRLSLDELQLAKPTLAEAISRDNAGILRGIRDELSTDEADFVEFLEDDTSPNQVRLGGRNATGGANVLDLTMGVAAGLNAHLTALENA